MTALPIISSIPSLSALERASILDTLFEPCTQLHTLSVSALHDHTFSSYNDLIAHVSAQLEGLLQSTLQSDRVWLDAILAAHPRLGETKVDSALSRKEQAGLKGEQQEESEAEAEHELNALRTLNGEYEKAFEGLKFVYVCLSRLYLIVTLQMSDWWSIVRGCAAYRGNRTFVNGRSRDKIKEEIKAKIEEGSAGTRTANDERKAAIEVSLSSNYCRCGRYSPEHTAKVNTKRLDILMRSIKHATSPLLLIKSLGIRKLLTV